MSDRHPPRPDNPLADSICPRCWMRVPTGWTHDCGGKMKRSRNVQMPPPSPRPDATPEAWHGAPLPTRCATCGDEPQVIRTRGGRIEGYRVACEACAVGTNWHPTRERAVTSWNVGRDEPAPTPPPPLPPGSPPSRWPLRVMLAGAALTLAGLATCALADVQTVPDGGAVTFFIEEVKV